MSDRDHQWKFFEHLWKVDANKAEREFAFKSGWDACAKVKQEEIDRLQSKLDCAVKALEFYADFKNWGWQNQTMLTIMKNSDDYDIREGFTSRHCGKRARLALEEIKG